MQRFTINELNSMSNKKFAILVLSEELGKRSNPYTPIANKLKSAISELEKEDDTASAIKALWDEFGDITMDPETELMEEPFLHFPAGTHREEIWEWFDKVYPKGVHALLYGE